MLAPVIPFPGSTKLTNSVALYIPDSVGPVALHSITLDLSYAALGCTVFPHAAGLWTHSPNIPPISEGVVYALAFFTPAQFAEVYRVALSAAAFCFLAGEESVAVEWNGSMYFLSPTELVTQLAAIGGPTALNWKDAAEYLVSHSFKASGTPQPTKSIESADPVHTDIEDPFPFPSVSTMPVSE